MCDRGIFVGAPWFSLGYMCALGVRSLEEKPRRSRCFIAPATVCQDDVLDKPHKENGGDYDEIFAMLSGMGEEEVHKVTLLEDKSPEEVETQTTAEKAADVVEEEEDQVAYNRDFLCHLIRNGYMAMSN